MFYTCQRLYIIVRIMLIVVVLLLITIALTGCNRNQDRALIGVWQNENYERTGTRWVFEFLRDGSGVSMITFSDIERTEYFTWNTSGDRLTKTFYNDNMIDNVGYLVSCDGSTLTLFYDATPDLPASYTIFIRVSEG